MNNSATITFVEGLPGSGKTTLSTWLQTHLQAHLVTEDSPHYPNDFSGIAGIPPCLYSTLVQTYPILKEYTFEYVSIHYVQIPHMESRYPHETDLIRLLRQWEFGNEFNSNITLEHYITCSLGLLFKWIEAIDVTGGPLILDSVLLQNPINELLFRNAPEETILHYCHLLANAFTGFQVNCIYLERDSAVQSIDFAARVKGVSWSSRVAKLIAQTPYGLANSLEGMDGMLRFFEHRRRIEKSLLSSRLMNHKVYLVNEQQWDQLREWIQRDFA
ncbi:MAG: hypothetical protein K0Q90_1790 [Paenibacillaceae bacterium]|jgi:hypothetical protein|nr:hypothetical protein [Paenibacillaceae bacterium]